MDCSNIPAPETTYVVNVYNQTLMLDNMEKGIMTELNKTQDAPIVDKIVNFIIKILIK